MKHLILFLALLPGLTGTAQDDKKNASINIHTTSVCGMCEETIEGELIYEKGVKSVDLDLETGIIHVQYDARRTDPDKVRQAVTKLGYGADGLPADPKAFAELPACCQKEGCGQPKDH